MGVIAWLVLGAFSGWIANRLMNSRTGLIDNIRECRKKSVNI